MKGKIFELEISQSHHMTLKIKIIYTKKYYSRLECIFEMKKELMKNGIELVGSNEDILLIHTPAAFENEKLIANKKPFILIERIDSCDILPITRNWVVKDNCIGIIKNTILDPIKLYNEPFCSDHRYFASIINNYAKLETPIQHQVKFDDRTLKKIKCILPYCLDRLMTFDKLSRLKGVIDRERDYDLHFVGLTKYDKYAKKPNLLNWHREKAVEQAEKLKDYNILIKYSGQRISRKKFLQQLQNTKVCLSPWGLGEFCWRDLEAIYCGAVLVKPNSDFLISYPNIYQNNLYYRPCLPDFSDLMEIVHDILDNWDNYTEMRERARKLLLSMWDNTKRAKEFAEVLIELNEVAGIN